MYVYETNGQYLARYLLSHHLEGAGRSWGVLGATLLPTNRAEEWVEAFKEMACLQLARRLIFAGDVLVRRHGIVAAESETKQAIVETMIVHWDTAGEIYERLLPAVRSAQETIKPSVRKEAEGFARREMSLCYLCGVEMVFGGGGAHLEFTLDHIWPRAYGGDSDAENLLGACRSCNEAKSSSASWAMYPVQSMVVGYDVANLAELPKSIRFAVQAKAVKSSADQRGLSLRDAYLDLGPLEVPAVRSALEAVDLFNLEYSHG